MKTVFYVKSICILFYPLVYKFNIDVAIVAIYGQRLFPFRLRSRQIAFPFFDAATDCKIVPAAYNAARNIPVFCS